MSSYKTCKYLFCSLFKRTIYVDEYFESFKESNFALLSSSIKIDWAGDRNIYISEVIAMGIMRYEINL